MSDARIALARWLVDAGAGVSARTVLGDLRGAPANRLRLAADRASLRPGVLALVALPDGRGLALPLVTSLGRPRAADPTFREACAAAHALASELLDAPSLPSLRFELEEELGLFGSSIGLGAALAYLAHFMPSRAPRRAVLATGRLLDGGRVAAVGHLPAKLAIAEAERGARMCLFPGEAAGLYSNEYGEPGGEVGPVLPGGETGRMYSGRLGETGPGRPDAAPDSGGVAYTVGDPAQGGGGAAMERVAVTTLAAAAERVLGPGPWRVDPGFSAVDDLLRRARTARDPVEGAGLLEAVALDQIALADQVRVMFDLGTLRRNAGESRGARELHERARGLLDPVRSVVGADIAERYELEYAATALDELDLGAALDWLRRRLTQPFLRSRNELRCRGMLAQGLSIAGSFEEALAVRSGNLALHERSAALSRSLPMTLCHLTLDAAFAGEEALFDAHAARLLDVTSPGDDRQARFNAASILRGLVALGRGAEALSWAEDRMRMRGVRIPATFAEVALGREAVTAQPELTAVRSLVRALRRTGELARAHRLAGRAPAAREGKANLFRWTASLVRLEQALTFLAAGQAEEAREACERAARELMESHPAATRHFGLLDAAPGEELERRIGRIWF